MTFTPSIDAACRRLDATERQMMLTAFSRLSQQWHDEGMTALAQVIDALVLELADARDEHARMVETFDEIVSPNRPLGPDEAP